MNIEWFEPWEEINTSSSYFEKQLMKEVSKGHILYGLDARAVGRREDCDDVLYKVMHPEFSYAVVHLTYTSKSDNVEYPKTKVFVDIYDWCQNCMLRDHKEFLCE